jgi:hypothetical protein
MRHLRIALLVTLAGMSAVACKRSTTTSQPSPPAVGSQTNSSVRVVGEFTMEDIDAITTIVKLEDSLNCGFRTIVNAKIGRV